MAVQVNGKTRGTIHVAPDATQQEALAAAMADPAHRALCHSDPARFESS